jgi:FixJ family two-component response regulator
MNNKSKRLPDEPASRPRLVLVEDDPSLRRSLQLRLFTQGFDVRAFPTASHALGDPSTVQAEVLVVDYRLPDSDGVNLLSELKQRGWVGSAILVTGFPSAQLAANAEAAGFRAVLEKPVPEHRLMAAIGAQLPR